MARTNRVHKKEVPQGTENAKTAVEKVYRVALYVRLSVLDSGKKTVTQWKHRSCYCAVLLRGNHISHFFCLYRQRGNRCGF